MHIDIIWIYLNGVRHGDSFRRATFIGKLSAIQSRLQDMNILKGRIEAAKARPVVWRSQVLEIRGVTQWYDMDWYGMLFYAYYTCIHISDHLENCLVMFGGDAAIFWSERYQVAVQKDKIPNARDELCNIFNHPKRVAAEVQSLSWAGGLRNLRRAGSAGS